MPNVDYLFQASFDLENWSSTAVTATASGSLDLTIAAPESEDHCYYRYAYEPTAGED